MYNIATCSGFVQKAGTYVASSSCAKARIMAVLLFFALAIIYRWGGEEIGLPIGRWSAFAGGLISYLIVVGIFGSAGFAFIIGLILGLVAGFVGYQTWEGDMM